MNERKKNCVAALHRKYFTDDDEDGLTALNAIKTLNAKKSVLSGFPARFIKPARTKRNSAKKYTEPTSRRPRGGNSRLRRREDVGDL
jgi:hypothetical protein